MPARVITLGAMLALTIALPPGYAQEQGQEKNAFKLSGGITHSESLEPLPESERVGAVQGTASTAAIPTVAIPANNPPALVNPYRKSSASSSTSPTLSNPAVSNPAVNNAAVSPSANQQTQIPTETESQARQRNLLLYSRTPHIDPGQALYKKRLREAAEQNTLATAVKRPGKLQIKVPFWLAGQWQRTESNELSRKELPSGKELKPIGKQAARVTDYFGSYKDRRGNVFMIVPLGAAGAVDRGFAVDYHRVKKYEMILDGKNSAVIKVQAVHKVVSKKEKRVVEAYQDEELNRYTLIRDGLVKNDSSVKVFDQLGQAKLITRAVSTERRVKRI
jgi:hypothetical protein